MNLSQVQKILKIAWRLKLSKKIHAMPIFTLVGDTGIGKSSIMNELVDELCASDAANFYETKYLAQVEVGDLIGMPDRNGDKTIWLKPDWWPEADARGVLFFDELSDAKTDVRAAVMPMLLTGKMHQNKLSDEILIVCAMNPVGGDFGGYTFTRQFKDRLAFLKVQPTIEEWQAFANKVNLPLYAKNMVAEQPDFFLDIKAANNSEADWATSEYYSGTNSRRSFTTAVQFYANMTDEEREDVGIELLSAIAGDAAAASIMSYAKRNITELIDPKDLFDKAKESALLTTVENWVNISAMDRLSAFMKLTKAMLKSDQVTKDNCRALAKLILILPEDVSMGLLTYIKGEVKSGQSILMAFSQEPEIFKRMHTLLRKPVQVAVAPVAQELEV